MKSFYSLINRLNSAPADEREMIEKVIWTTFGVTKAVFVLDMCGFSHNVSTSGILSFLQKIRNLHLFCQPIIKQHHGDIVKQEADNVFAVFDNADDAINAGKAIIATLKDTKAVVSANKQISVSIGIDYGRFLLIPDADMFGDPVNRACKLGEDTAGPNELIISDKALKTCTQQTKMVMKHFIVDLSGIKINACSIKL